MAQTELMFSETSYAGAGTYRQAQDLIRPNLRRAFPLPEASQGEERFRRLLEALGQRSGGPRPGESGAQPAQDMGLNDRALVTLLVGTALGGLAAVIGGAYGVSLLVALLP